MSSLVLEVSDAEADVDWDDFVVAAPGGHHLQTSGWGQAKSVLGWRAVRVVARRGGTVIAGCQLLVRSFGLFGSLAFAPRGPLAVSDEDVAVRAVLDQIDALVLAERIRYLRIQPPTHRDDLGNDLIRRGFAPSSQEAAPVSTVLVDLEPDEDQILAAFRPSTRSNVRKATRRGVHIRAGGESDLDTFTRLVAQTAERHGFLPYPPVYYERMWGAFAAGGHARLLLAEHDECPLSAILVIGFGDTAVYKMGGWSGARCGIHPNELLHWHAMRWARAAGYRYYDLGGIPVEGARAVLRGEASESVRNGTTRFKLGFGGEVKIFPGAYDRGRPRVVGDLARRAAPRMLPLTHRILGR